MLQNKFACPQVLFYLQISENFKALLIIAFLTNGAIVSSHRGKSKELMKISETDMEETAQSNNQQKEEHLLFKVLQMQLEASVVPSLVENVKGLAIFDLSEPLEKAFLGGHEHMTGKLTDSLMKFIKSIEMLKPTKLVDKIYDSLKEICKKNEEEMKTKISCEDEEQGEGEFDLFGPALTLNAMPKEHPITIYLYYYWHMADNIRLHGSISDGPKSSPLQRLLDWLINSLIAQIDSYIINEVVRLEPTITDQDVSWTLLPIVVRTILKPIIGESMEAQISIGRPLHVFSPDNLRNECFMDKVVDCIYRAGKSGKPSPVELVDKIQLFEMDKITKDGGHIHKIARVKSLLDQARYWVENKYSKNSDVEIKNKEELDELNTRTIYEFYAIFLKKLSREFMKINWLEKLTIKVKTLEMVERKIRAASKLVRSVQFRIAVSMVPELARSVSLNGVEDRLHTTMAKLEQRVILLAKSEKEGGHFGEQQSSENSRKKLSKAYSSYIKKMADKEGLTLAGLVDSMRRRVDQRQSRHSELIFKAMEVEAVHAALDETEAYISANEKLQTSEESERIILFYYKYCWRILTDLEEEIEKMPSFVFYWLNEFVFAVEEQILPRVLGRGREQPSQLAIMAVRQSLLLTSLGEVNELAAIKRAFRPFHPPLLDYGLPVGGTNNIMSTLLDCVKRAPVIWNNWADFVGAVSNEDSWHFLLQFVGGADFFYKIIRGKVLQAASEFQANAKTSCKRGHNLIGKLFAAQRLRYKMAAVNRASITHFYALMFEQLRQIEMENKMLENMIGLLRQEQENGERQIENGSGEKTEKKKKGGMKKWDCFTFSNRDKSEKND